MGKEILTDKQAGRQIENCGVDFLTAFWMQVSYIVTMQTILDILVEQKELNTLRCDITWKIRH